MLRSARSVLAAVLLILAAGCDLFSTRDAEPPPGNSRGTWETPRQPADVLDNLRSALFERNSVNYLRSFDPASFRFVPDALALSRDPSLADWDYSDESRHIARLLSEGALPGDSTVVVVFPDADVVTLGDSAQIHTTYELRAGVVLSGVPHRVAGTADFTLRVGGEGYWQIQLWRDTRTEDEATWSDFKSLVR